MRRRIRILVAGERCICGAMMGAARSCALVKSVDGSTQESPLLGRRPWRVSAWARRVQGMMGALVKRKLWRKGTVRGNGGEKEVKKKSRT